MNDNETKGWLEAIGAYWVYNRCVGHTTLMRHGIDNMKCLLLSHSKDFTLRTIGTLGRPIYNIGHLRGETRPLAVDHWFLGNLLLSALRRINELEAEIGAKKGPVG